MAFIRYTEKGKSFAAKVSLSTTGMISFNDGSRKRFGMDEYKYCVLFYDPETMKVGVRLTNDEKEEGVRKLRLRKGTGADVAAKSFLDFFEIVVTATTIYEAAKNEDDLIVFDLTKGKERGSKESKTTNDRTEELSTEQEDTST